MKNVLLATAAALIVAAAGLHAQKIDGTSESHLAASKKAAGTQWTALQQRVCESAIPAPQAGRAGGAGGGGGGGGGAGGG
jgi:hypothetical protein